MLVESERESLAIAVCTVGLTAVCPVRLIVVRIVGLVAVRMAGSFQGWSGRKNDGSADVTASCLGESLGSVGEAAAGGDRNPRLPVPWQLGEASLS